MTTSAADGSQTAVISTEHTLATITAAGKYTLNVNSVNQVSGDTLFLRIYIKVRSSGALTLAYESCFEGAQTQIILISEDVDSTNEISYTLEQTTGTGRVYEWEVMQKTDADNAGITANGNAIAALNDFDPASDTVANVTLVATTTTNTDQRGTDNAATAANLAIVDGNVDSILVDTGTTIPAQIAALNNFDPSSDAVANVTLVATVTTNTDMRGTDSAATAANLAIVDTNVDAILVDTSTTIPGQISGLNDIAATDIVSAGAITTLAGAVANVDLVDVTTTNSDMRGTDSANTLAPDNAGITANGVAIAALNDFNPTTDAVANVTLVATTTTNSDMRGTDSAATAANLAIVDGNVDAILVDTSTTIPATIADLPTVAEFNARTLVAANYFDPAADTVANVTLVATTTTNTDMRGTDGANTLAPDNAGITANGVAIAALNDIAATDIVSNGAITTLAGAVVNVDLVDTTTTNTDMRGTDSAATATALATVDANVDAILIDTSTTIPAQITALNDFNPSTDAVALVTLVTTTTTNSDMRGTDGANTIAPDNAGISSNGAAIAALNDFNPVTDTVANVTLVATVTTNTDMRGTNNAATATALATVDTNVDAILVDTSTTIPAQISGLNDFNPTTDTVANVALVATTTTNTDMRGTDGANTTTPDNAGITANGVAIAALNDFDPGVDVVARVTLTDTVTANTDMRGTNNAATAANLATVDANVDAILIDTSTTIPAQITALNDFDPATDAVANVTLVGTTTTNTDMRGTDGANTTTPDNAGIAANGVAIAALNDFDPAIDTVARVTLVDVTTLNTDMRGTNGANTTTPDNAGITANGVAIAGLNDFNAATDTVARVTLVDTTTLNTDMRGTDSANTLAPDNAGITANGVAIAALNDFDPAVDVVARVTLTDTTTANTDMRGTDGANATAPDNAGITANGLAIAALNDLGPAQVNAEVLDVITVDVFPEPSAVPASTSSILEKLNWLAVLSRNKITQTATTQTVRDDADFSDIATATVSDDGTTTTREEYAS